MQKLLAVPVLLMALTGCAGLAFQAQGVPIAAFYADAATWQDGSDERTIVNISADGRTVRSIIKIYQGYFSSPPNYYFIFPCFFLSPLVLNPSFLV